jgi:hypothetical protein
MALGIRCQPGDDSARRAGVSVGCAADLEVIVEAIGEKARTTHKTSFALCSHDDEIARGIDVDTIGVIHT